jgi:TonB family protein
MSERKPCIRCERAIDQWSKLCPFCNWDQNNPDPPPVKAPQQAAAPVSPKDDLKETIKRKGLYAGGGVLILILSFLIGMVINSDDAVDKAPEPLAEQAGKQNQGAKTTRADTPLVPTNERGGIEQPITSAPTATSPDAMSDGYDRSDATAVSSVEYNQLARRAKAEKERMSVVVDPRSLTGVAYAQGQRLPVRRPATQVAQAGAPPLPGASAPAPQAPAPRSFRTRPIPEYQPIPRIYARGTARLSLTVGPDGRVRDINIERALDRNTADLVAAVQRWRFRPATENGEPITAPYSVDISFGGQ